MKKLLFVSLCTLLPFVASYASHPTPLQLKSINQQINLDFQRRAENDQRFTHSVLAKYQQVRQDFPNTRLLISYVQHVTPKGTELEPHTVLAVVTDRDIWIMDYELLNVYTSRDRRDLKPVTSIEILNEQVWVHRNAADWSIHTTEVADDTTTQRFTSFLNTIKTLDD